MTSAGHATPRSRLHRIYLVVLVFLKDKYVLYVYLYLFKDTNGGRTRTCRRFLSARAGLAGISCGLVADYYVRYSYTVYGLYCLSS